MILNYMLLLCSKTVERIINIKTNNIVYRRIGDYNISNPLLPFKEEKDKLSKWVMICNGLFTVHIIDVYSYRI